MSSGEDLPAVARELLDTLREIREGDFLDQGAIHRARVLNLRLRPVYEFLYGATPMINTDYPSSVWWPRALEKASQALAAAESGVAEVDRAGTRPDARDVDPTSLWSAIRGPFVSLTFGQMKAAAGASGLPTVRLARLQQSNAGGGRSTSKGELADAIDALFLELNAADQLATVNQLVNEITTLLPPNRLDELASLLERNGGRSDVQEDADEQATETGTSGPTVDAVRSIFVSHSQADKELADEFVDNLFRLGMGLGSEQIFYSSRPSTGIPGGQPWMPFLRDRLTDAQVTVLLITPSFLKSEFCLIEAGAAWLAGSLVAVSMIDDRGPFDSIQILDGRSPEALDAFAKQIVSEVGGTLDVGQWNSGKTRFLASLALD